MNTEETLYVMLSKAPALKERTGNLDLIKIKSFSSAIDSVKRIRRQTIVWEKIFAKEIPDKRL